MYSVYLSLFLYSSISSFHLERNLTDSSTYGFLSSSLSAFHSAEINLLILPMLCPLFSSMNLARTSLQYNKYDDNGFFGLFGSFGFLLLLDRTAFAFFSSPSSSFLSSPPSFFVEFFVVRAFFLPPLPPFF